MPLNKLIKPNQKPIEKNCIHHERKTNRGLVIMECVALITSRVSLKIADQKL